MTRARSVRVPDHVWDRARTRAASEGTTITAVILTALTDYAHPTTEGPTPMPTESGELTALADVTPRTDRPKCDGCIGSAYRLPAAYTLALTIGDGMAVPGMALCESCAAEVREAFQ